MLYRFVYFFKYYCAFYASYYVVRLIESVFYLCKQSEEQIIDADINESGSDASTGSEGDYGHFPFIRAPRPPTKQEAAINECSNFVWPDLSSVVSVVGRSRLM